MSWPLASFALVALVLGVGWLAYERSRPSARMVALVGTLAGLAALGRDAFAALPDVKPITAITLVVGYALGPLPGFSVGAIGMLASNVLLGEGSYTPWQMAAWGIVGLAGALLAKLTRRRSGRVGLALACGLTAAAAKEVMNVYEWTLGASHTGAALLVTVAKGLPFDVADVVSSFLFGLAFAPELARLLGRMRVRMTVSWAPTAPLLVLAFLAVTSAGGAWIAPSVVPGGYADSALASPPAESVAISAQVRYLQMAQNADGGFGGAAGQRTSELYSAWAALGLAAAGRQPASLARDGHTVLQALLAEASGLESVGDVERTILALHACDAPPTVPGMGDLIARLLRSQAADGSFEGLVNLTSFAILSLRATARGGSDPAIRTAYAWLVAQQAAGGGFSYAPHGGALDVDDTAAALQAIVAAGERDSQAAARATVYLLQAINHDGGYPQQPGGESNAQSTAWAIQALVAAGQDPSRRWHGAVRSPLAYLKSLIAPDGSVRYSHLSSQTPVWVTSQALTALARKPLPISLPRASGGNASWNTPASGRTADKKPAAWHSLIQERADTPRQTGMRHGQYSVHSNGAHRLTAQLMGGFAGQTRLNVLARAAGVLVGLLLGSLLAH